MWLDLSGGVQVTSSASHAFSHLALKTSSWPCDLAACPCRVRPPHHHHMLRRFYRLWLRPVARATVTLLSGPDVIRQPERHGAS